MIVTRGHAHDEEALYTGPDRAGYVGMIGSKRKIKLIYEDLLAAAFPPRRWRSRPLGFAIVHRRPEIAVSIVAS